MTTNNVTDKWLAPAPAGARLPWLDALRGAGREAFAAHGFPTTKEEAWKYTNLAPIARGTFESAASAPQAKTAETVPLGGPRLAFVNGIFSQERSRLGGAPAGVVIGRLADACREQADVVRTHLGQRFELAAEPLAALNTAHLDDGAFVYVPRGVAVAEPIEIVFHAAASKPVAIHPRVLIVLEENASAVVVERYVGQGERPTFTNAVSEIVLGENASLRHVKTQEESEEAFHVGSVWAHQARSSNLQSCSISLGSALARTDITTVLDGPGAECGLDGLYVGRNRQHVDHHTTIDHRSAHATSRELYKGVLDDAATGVFNGRVFVRQDAQKSDAQQMNKNLLLSDSATVDTKPQLEIFADDVKCAHGATIGRLDAMALFYLRSRGIDAVQAREILIYAFANEMLMRIPIEPLRDDLERALGSRFAAAPVRAAA